MKKLTITLGLLFTLTALQVQAKTVNNHNASRSNVTSSKVDKNGGNATGPSKAQDWNSSRSNKTSKTARKVDPKKKKKDNESKD